MIWYCIKTLSSIVLVATVNFEGMLVHIHPFLYVCA